MKSPEEGTIPYVRRLTHLIPWSNKSDMKSDPYLE